MEALHLVLSVTEGRVDPLPSDVVAGYLNRDSGAVNGRVELGEYNKGYGGSTYVFNPGLQTVVMTYRSC